MMDTILLDFLSEFQQSFTPPLPYRGQSGNNWLVSRVWTDYVKGWLASRYEVHHEYSLPERQRLDAALWPKRKNQSETVMDIALEWEWNHTSVAKCFPGGDFRKLLEVDAHSGLAIVQTRADGSRGSGQADGTVRDLQRRCKEYRRDSRSVALIEIRRVFHHVDRVEFQCYFHDLNGAKKEKVARWCYP